MRNAGLWLVIVSLMAGSALNPPRRPGLEESGPHTRRFELRSGPRSGLFHFLIDWALADAEEWPPFAPPIVEREAWRSGLSGTEARLWGAATQAFGTARDRSLLFDNGLLAVRDWAAGAEEREAIPDSDQYLASALEAALPVYERHWWPAHDARNRSWIEAVEGTLAEIEETMIPRFERAYGGRWPDAPIPVDVVVYANSVGAYSSGGRITIASGERDSQMPQALELIFHEASHLDPLEAPLRMGLKRAFDAVGTEVAARLWHDMIFYTAGEITRITLEGRGESGYRHYGELGVYTRGERWAIELPAFERRWRPFLRSESTDAGARAAALEAFAREISAGTSPEAEDPR